MELELPGWALVWGDPGRVHAHACGCADPDAGYAMATLWAGIRYRVALA